LFKLTTSEVSKSLSDIVNSRLGIISDLVQAKYNAI